MQGFLFLVCLFFTPISQGKVLKVAIFDTGFCLHKSKEILKSNTNYEILSPIDLTNSLSKNCDDYEINKRRYHGQKVLDLFLLTLNQNIKVKIQPYIIFDKNGYQSGPIWQKLMTKQFQNNHDLYILAAGLPLRDKKNIKTTEILTKIFLASGRRGRGIKKETILYPQVLAPNKNIFIIGSFQKSYKSDQFYSDPGLLYKGVISYSFPDSHDSTSLNGTSRAVALAAAKAINLCAKNLQTELRSCLQKKRIKVNLIKKEQVIYTY